jgi:hypothetical protein
LSWGKRKLVRNSLYPTRPKQIQDNKEKILATWIIGLKSGFTRRYIYEVEEKSPEQQFEGNIHDILTSRHYK